MKVDLDGSLNGQDTDDKKPEISKIKAKIIYLEASIYGKKVKNLEFSENFSVFELEYIITGTF